MAEGDWTYLNDGLDVNAVARGVTAGIARPPGGGQFLFGFNSLASVVGASGLFVSIQNFAPMPKGGSIRGCIQRGPSGGPTSFTPLFFASAQGPSVNDLAYLLGLSDDDPHHIVLRKGPIVNGAGSATDPGVLLRSADSFALGDLAPHPARRDRESQRRRRAERVPERPHGAADRHGSQLGGRERDGVVHR